MSVDPRTPVLAAAAMVTQRCDDPTDSAEAVVLMGDAVEAACSDHSGLAAAIDLVLVPNGTWSYPDPGRLVAQRFGADARTVVAEVGILQESLFARASATIAEGAADVVLVCGGEAKQRNRLAQRAGLLGAEETAQPGLSPDEFVVPDHDILPDIEIERQLAVPIHQYAVMETALRHRRGQSVSEHRTELDSLWARFGQIAAKNPLAWNRSGPSARQLDGTDPANPTVASPYTRLHCSQWNVDQAGAVVFCSAEAADRFGISRDAWVFPVASAVSNSMIPLTQRAEMGACPAVGAAGDWLTEVTGMDPDAADLLDIYSCFPSAVQIQADELSLSRGRDLTVTGGMSFGGGPLNNYSIGALAVLSERLRHEGGTGLLTSVSGMLTKTSASMWSSQPATHRFADTDVASIADHRTPTVEVDPQYSGETMIESYTVIHHKGVPAIGLVVGAIPNGRRCLALSDDADLATAMTDGEWCGRNVTVAGSSLLGPGNR
jgi:acetyl-CoA C-acetyltransferase